jgi:hypothetical protein
MTLQSAVALGGAVLLLGFIAFAFRQGTKVKPSGRPADDGSGYGGGEGHSGGDGGH